MGSGRGGGAAEQRPHRPDSAWASGLRARLRVSVYRRPILSARRFPMTTHSWIRRVFSPTPRTIRKARARVRPAVEVDGDCSGGAIAFGDDVMPTSVINRAPAGHGRSYRASLDQQRDSA